MKRRIIHLFLALVIMTVLVISARSVESIARQKAELEVTYLPSSDFMKIASLGYRNIASDLLWFKAIQYYGGYVQARNDLALFSHLADVITDLDPKFVGAYKLSAFIIAEDLGEYEEGVKLMEKGLGHNPEDYWLAYEMGFLHYLGGRDYSEASRYFSHAATLPGADERAARFAADAAKKGGDYETSIALWSEVAKNTEDKYIRMMAEKYIEEIEEKIGGVESKESVLTGPGMEGR